MRTVAFSALLLSLATPLSAAETTTSPTKLAVLPLGANGLSPAKVEILSDLVTAAVDAAKRYDVLSVKDLNAMLGFERIKDVAGCSDAVCGAEIGGALGVDLILSGSVSVLGDELIVQLALIDTQSPKVVSRGRTVVANDEKLYRGAIEAAAAQITGVGNQTPPQPQPKKATVEIKPGASPARFAFETQDSDYDFSVSVTTQDGATVRCDPTVRLAAPCVLQGLMPGKARLNVANAKLQPFVGGFTVRNANELYDIQVRSIPGTGSILAWTFGGTSLGMGTILMAVGLPLDIRGMVYASIPLAVVGAGVTILGFFFDRRIDVNYPGIDFMF